MSLSLIFLLLGAALLAASTVAYRHSEALAVRVVSAGTLAAGALMFLIGMVNALSGTL